jgi:hypothetical protein
MKYLKKFNEELRPSTYRTAANKLRQIGHVRRSSVLDDWSNKVENDNEVKERNDTINKLKEFGHFKMNFIKSKKVMMTGNFYIDIGGLDSYNFKDNYFDNTVYSKSEGGSRVVSHDVIMNFELGFIPADEETYKEFNELDIIDREKIYYSLYWNMNFGISIIRKGEEEINPNGYYYFDGNDSDLFEFYDRKEASRFRKLLFDALSGNNEWGKSNYSESLKSSILKVFSEDKYQPLPKDIFNEESYQKIVNSIRSLSLNKLYSE